MFFFLYYFLDLVGGHTCTAKEIDEEAYYCHEQIYDDDVLTSFGTVLWVVFTATAIVWGFCVSTRTCWYLRYNVGDELDHMGAFKAKFKIAGRGIKERGQLLAQRKKTDFYNQEQSEQNHYDYSE